MYSSFSSFVSGACIKTHKVEPLGHMDLNIAQPRDSFMSSLSINQGVVCEQLPNCFCVYFIQLKYAQHTHAQHDCSEEAIMAMQLQHSPLDGLKLQSNLGEGQ